MDWCQPLLSVNERGKSSGRAASGIVRCHRSRRARRPSVELLFDGAVYFLWDQSENLWPEAAAGDAARFDQLAKVAVRQAQPLALLPDRFVLVAPHFDGSSSWVSLTIGRRIRSIQK